VTDADLVARARQGDTAAFGELIDRHRSAVYRAARAALGSHADAEDAAQEAFLRAFRRLNDFRGEASFKTWLLAIAWHQAINRRRSLTRMWRRIIDPDRTDPEIEMANLPACSSTPEDAAVHAQLHAAVRDQIRALPSKLRDALLLAQSGEYTYAEISTMVGVPVGTVKWRVSEARRVIKLRLLKRGHGTFDGR
jgi:RNA polymerase sigma-70 factor (ECF subfamily)